jgi:hypothetical protein
MRSLVKITIVLLLTTGSLSAATKDSVLFRYKSGKDSVKILEQGKRREKYVRYYENGNPLYISWSGIAGKYHSRSYYEDGSRRTRSNCSIFNVLHGTGWDEKGRRTRRSRQHPFSSTSYTRVERERTFSASGRKIKYEFRKEGIGCYGGKGMIRSRVIEYDERGRVTRKERKGRKKIREEKQEREKARRLRVGS